MSALPAVATAVRLPLPILQGERSLLRPLVPADAESLRLHGDNARVAACMYDGFPHPFTQEIADALCAQEAGTGAGATGYDWGIVFDGHVIGCIGLAPQSGWLRCNAEMTYWIGETFWKRGIVSDAVRQVTDWAFAALPELTRVFVGAFSWNEGSQAVARHAGFVREGVLKQSAIKDGKVIDRVLWASYRATMERRAADIGAALAISANIAMERG